MTRLAALLLLLAPPLLAAEIDLKPGGPIATLEAARDAARAAPKPVTIRVHAGRYALEKPLVLEAADSGVTWAAAPGAAPVISGGRAISGWKDAGDGIWRVDLPAVREGGWRFEQLWVNGQRATRARSPNRGYFHITESVGPNVFPGMGDPQFHGFCVAKEQYDLLRAVPAAERGDVLLTVTHAWAVGQCRIQELNDAALAVRIQGRSRYPFVTYEADQRWWVENFRAALDAPGEWFLDTAAGTLWYKPRPGEELGTVEAVAPVAAQFVVASGVRDLVLQGLRFLHGNYAYPKEGLHDGQASSTLDGALDFTDASGVRVENVEVGHIGRYAVYFRNGCSDSLVRHCHLHDLGAGGVRIGETGLPSEDRVCRDIRVEDTIVQHGGRLHPSACGILLTHTRNCLVAHNDIGDFYYTGVSAGWNWGYGESLSRENRIENNHIHHLGWAYLSDMGGFYGLGVAPGTRVTGNHIHHVASHRYGGWGLYTDEGSTDVWMENNLVHDTSDSGFHQHYGFYNRVRNNIFAFGRKAQVQRSRPEGRTSFFFERNIVVWDPASPLLDGGEYNWKPKDAPERGDPRDPAVFRNNLYFQTDGKIPDLLAKKWSWDEWRKLGRDAGSRFADPLFENLAARDFRLKPGSPAAQVGFKPWDLALAGVRIDGPDGPAWRERAKQGWTYPTWDTDAKPWPAPVYRIARQTFENAELWTIGIRNASPDTENKGDIICVSEDAASPLPVDGAAAPSKRSLKIQDAPGLSRTYMPILHVTPNWDDGRFEAEFDLMAQEGADGMFELRTDKGGEYALGPLLTWNKGRLAAGKGAAVKLAEFAPGEWIRLLVTATPGAGSFQVTLTRGDGRKEEFPAIPCGAAWNMCHYVLWSGTSDNKAAFFLDNLRLERVAP